ncbi:hypothetical protein [Tranquillimonas alkanivorans]|nr:hypothetical protein [Tranquillimonas alkanivorans]
MLRDRAAIENPPPLAGLISNIGIVMLGIPLVLLWIALLKSGTWSKLELATVALPTLIVADDLAMLHEGRGEMLFYAGYAAAGVWLAGLQVLRSRKQSWLLLSAFACLGAAMFSDFIRIPKGGQDFMGLTAWGARAFAEDALKFMGYALLAAHLYCCAKEVLQRGE